MAPDENRDQVSPCMARRRSFLLLAFCVAAAVLIFLAEVGTFINFPFGLRTPGSSDSHGPKANVPQRGFPSFLTKRQAASAAVEVNDSEHLAITDWMAKEFEAGGFGEKSGLGVLSFVMIVTCFYVLGHTADAYFTPALQALAALLRLPESIAGATLLALGNGAPDVFSLIAAFSAQTVPSPPRPGASEADVKAYEQQLCKFRDSIVLGVSGTLGGACFVTMVVFAAVIWVQPEQAKVHRRPFFRDVGCFILAVTCLLFVVLNQGAVYRWEAILLLVLYFVYVAGTFAASYILKQTRARKGRRMGSQEESGTSDALVTKSAVSVASLVDRVQIPELEVSPSVVIPTLRVRSESTFQRRGADQDVVDDAANSLIGGDTHGRTVTSDVASAASGLESGSVSDAATHRSPSFLSPGSIADSQSTPRSESNLSVNHLPAPSPHLPATPTRSAPLGTTDRLRPGHSLLGSSMERFKDLLSLSPPKQVDRSLSAQLNGEDEFGLAPLSSVALEKAAMARKSSFATRYSMSRDQLTPNSPRDMPRSPKSPIMPNFLFSFDFFEKRGSTEMLANEKTASLVSAMGSVEPPPLRRLPDIVASMEGINKADEGGVRSGSSSAAEALGIPSQDIDEVSRGKPPVLMGAFSSALDLRAHQERLKWIVQHEYRAFEDMPIYAKSFYVMAAPLVIVRNATIPVGATLDEWNPYRMVANVGITPVFVCWALGFGPSEVGALPVSAVFGVSLALATTMALTINYDQIPWFWPTVYPLAAFLSCVLWIFKTADFLVDLLRLMGMMLSISEAIMGVTVLAWGNSVGDLFADMSISRAGAPSMAIAAVYAGPLFNLLVGMGCALLIATMTQPEIPGLHFSSVMVVNTCVLLGSLLVSLVLFPLAKFQLTRIHGLTMLCIYVGFMAYNIYAAVDAPAQMCD